MKHIRWISRSDVHASFEIYPNIKFTGFRLVYGYKGLGFNFCNQYGNWREDIFGSGSNFKLKEYRILLNVKF